MSTSTERSIPAAAVVDPDGLVCAGCAELAVGMPPVGWPTSAGRRPEFSHRDGSVLCPDSTGRMSEPVEAPSVRFWLTEAGASALDEAGGRS